MRISEKTLGLLKQGDLREQVQSLIGPPAKKTQSNWWWVSPFGSERTPSFAVTSNGPKGNLFKCFSQGIGGNDIISFVRHWQPQMGFVDAVKFIADQVGVEVEFDGSENRLSGNDPYGINRHYQNEWAGTLAKCQPVKDWLLRERAVSHEVASEYGVGYCIGGHIPEWHTQDELVQYDIMRAGTSGDYWTFNQRVTFPFRTLSGQITGFYGRGVEAGRHKHLNTKGTEIFHKSDNWFGLHENWRHIRKEGIAYICEGQFDVVGQAEAGVRLFISTGGAQFSHAHAKTVRGLGLSKVVLAFDGDTYGMKKNLDGSVSYQKGKLLSALSSLISAGVVPDILFLPPQNKNSGDPKMDPDEIRKHHDNSRYLKEMTMPVQVFASKMIRYLREWPQLQYQCFRDWMDTWQVDDGIMAKMLVDSFSAEMKAIGFSEKDIYKHVIPASMKKVKPKPDKPDISHTPWYRLIQLGVHYPENTIELMEMIESGLEPDSQAIDFGFVSLGDGDRPYKDGSFVLRDSLLDRMKDHIMREGEQDLDFKDSDLGGMYAGMAMMEAKWDEYAVRELVIRVRQDRLEEIRNRITDTMKKAASEKNWELYEQAENYLQLTQNA